MKPLSIFRLIADNKYLIIMFSYFKIAKFFGRLYHLLRFLNVALEYKAENKAEAIMLWVFKFSMVICSD